MTAPDVDRAQRNLREDITRANLQLKAWRRDGNAEKITYWANRLDQLLDLLPT